MNNSGDAAEQIVKMSLEGVEVAARITGTAAKEVAILLIAALKNDKKGNLKLKGKTRLNSMLKSGKPLEIYSIRERDLPKFVRGAKEYGIVYCALRHANNNQGLCDIMVKADDAPKVARLTDRFKINTVDKAKIESEIVRDMERKKPEAKQSAARPEQDGPGSAPGAEPEAPDVNDTEKLLDDLLGDKEGKSEPNTPKPENTVTENTKTVKPGPERFEPDKPDKRVPEPERQRQARPGNEVADDRPFAKDGRSPSNRQSGHTYAPRKNSEKASEKPSVKELIREIKAERKEKESTVPKKDERTATAKPKPNRTTGHIQPPKSVRPKTNSKGVR